MLLGRSGEMCYLNKLLMLSVLGWLFQVKQNNFCFFSNPKTSAFLSPVLFPQPLYDELAQIPVIPEDIFFTSEFTEVAKLEEGDDNSAELVSRTFHRSCFLLENV